MATFICAFIALSTFFGGIYLIKKAVKKIKQHRQKKKLEKQKKEFYKKQAETIKTKQQKLVERRIADGAKHYTFEAQEVKGVHIPVFKVWARSKESAQRKYKNFIKEQFLK